MTLSELIEQAEWMMADEPLAFGQGTTSAHDEAAWLVLWSLKLPLDTNLNSFLTELSEHQISTSLALVHKRIKSRLPTAYLTHEAWLQGVDFFVDARCIIPRSLIAEVLCDGTLDSYLQAEPNRILDLCTGNASLAVLAAMVYPNALVDASDLSQPALEVAQINVARHQLQTRINLLELAGLHASLGKYDLILCNPPYVNTQSMADLPDEFKAEPALAMAGGLDGMDFVRDLLKHASNHLTDQGLLILEIGHERGHFQAAFPTLNPYWLFTSTGEEQVLLLHKHQLSPTDAST